MTSPIPFNRTHDIDYGVCEQISPLVRRVTANNPSPFTFKGTGTYIIGTGEIAVIDPGPLDETHLTALLDATMGEKISHILVTHTHNDHCELVPKFKEATGARVYAFGAHDERAISGSGSVELDASADHAFKPDVEVKHGDKISGTDWSMECIFTPGHTSNHMSFALQEENALFVGDHVMAWSTSVIAPPDGNMADYMASLNLLLEHDHETYWPTHGGPITNPKPFVQAFIEHRQSREQSILARLHDGDQTIEDMIPKIYSDIDPKLYPAAALSVFAHMEHLVEQGLVETPGPITPSAAYTLK